MKKLAVSVPVRRSHRNRLTRVYARQRYKILFYSLLLTLAASPTLASLQLRSSLLQVFLFVNLLAALVPVARPLTRRLMLCFVGVASLLQAGGWWFQDSYATASGLLLWTAIGILATFSCVRFAMKARAVDREHLYSALDAYLLFGLFLGVLYWALDRFTPESFVMANRDADAPLSLSAAIYFSFVTLVTLGYGDVVPHSDIARSLSVVEALTGQLYLTVMVAHLVSLHVSGKMGRDIH